MMNWWKMTGCRGRKLLMTGVKSYALSKQVLSFRHRASASSSENMASLRRIFRRDVKARCFMRASPARTPLAKPPCARSWVLKFPSDIYGI